MKQKKILNNIVCDIRKGKAYIYPGPDEKFFISSTPCIFVPGRYETNFHRSLQAAKKFVRSEFCKKGDPKLKWVENEEEKT